MFLDGKNHDKRISIFVDESGSFSPAGADLHSPYYILCMVFHDQSDDISGELDRLRDAFGRTGIDPDHTIHATSTASSRNAPSLARYVTVKVIVASPLSSGLSSLSFVFCPSSSVCVIDLL